MQRKNTETKYGKINFAYRKGNPLIVFLNGFGSFDTAQSFSKVIESLPNEYGIFAPDYLNSGFSDEVLDAYTITDEANELVKIINSLKAKEVIILAHSIGGVYAMQMQNKINNLKAFIGIEPTTREVILNPPKDPIYVEKSKNAQNLEEQIKKDLTKILTSKEYEEFWNTTEQNAQKFDEKADSNAQASLENDSYWKSNIKLVDTILAVLITEEYRKAEYKRSEYFSNNANSKVILLGESHYIHFEYPKEIADIVKKTIEICE
ncbi:alpha/beta hydrolase [uncultured Lactobacillus sp.]|uniref:alpha/beta hydrolase n=1 Tax=uncultured Lactobacillus sp. TaxID=153152 RepID=UPI002804DF03|nr:alpha/beta hydrolase [uncultured Lactobacillus sp.]